MHVPKASTPLDAQYDAMLIDGDDLDVIDSEFSVDCTLYLGEGEGTRSLGWGGHGMAFMAACLFLLTCGSWVLMSSC